MSSSGARSSVGRSGTSMVTLCGSDGQTMVVEKSAAMVSIMLKNIIENNYDGSVIDVRVEGRILMKVVEYCKAHAVGSNVLELNAFDDDFINVEPGVLFDLVTVRRILNAVKRGEGIGGDSGRGEESKASDKRRRILELELEHVPGNRRVKKKNFGSDKYDTLMEPWSQSMNARKEKNLAKADRYKSHSTEATNSVQEEYSIGECMDKLNKLCGVSKTSYNKALQFFISLDWRKIFMHMTDDRKIDWLNDLN
ncbi:hypothetical protein OROHE_015432 [Orobanche hederae]